MLLCIEGPAKLVSTLAVSLEQLDRSGYFTAVSMQQSQEVSPQKWAQLVIVASQFATHIGSIVTTHAGAECESGIATRLSTTPQVSYRAAICIHS